MFVIKSFCGVVITVENLIIILYAEVAQCLAASGKARRAKPDGATSTVSACRRTRRAG